MGGLLFKEEIQLQTPYENYQFIRSTCIIINMRARRQNRKCTPQGRAFNSHKKWRNISSPFINLISSSLFHTTKVGKKHVGQF